MITIFLFIYAAINRYLISLHSIRFSKVVMEMDGACFFDVGKAILDGKVLYKDVFDHKTPYIYFINAFGSLISYNHIGLYIIEVLVLFSTIYYIYKIIRLILKNNNFAYSNELALIGALLMSVVFSIRKITFLYCRTEAFAVAFLLPAVYIFFKYCYRINSNEVKSNVYTDNFVSRVIDIKNKMFVIGILAGLTFMTNIKGAILFVPFAVLTLGILLKYKQYKTIFTTFISGIFGVIVSILPYIIYMIFTGSFNDMVYAIVNTNIAYANSKIPMTIYTNNMVLNYNPNEGLLSTIYMFMKMEMPAMLMCYISIILFFAMKYNVYIKLVSCMQVITAFLYIMMSGRIHTYYLYIMIPFFTIIYIFIIYLINKFIKNIKTNFKILYNKFYISILTIVVAIFLLYIGFYINSYDLNVLNNNYTSRAKQLNYIINSYNKKDKSDIKVLALGFSPEVYVYLDSKINYKYFITPSVDYKEDKTCYLEQYKYVSNMDPDIIVQAQNSLDLFPKDIKMSMMLAVNTYYDFIGQVNMNDADGSYYIYGRK